MEIFLALILLAFGIFLLIKGADFLVDGASSIGKKMNISPIVIGLTIVSFGTSAPELLISLVSAVSGETELAFSNLIGSNIANILLILGASAIVYPLVVNKNTVWKEIPMSFLATLIVGILAFQIYLDEKQFAAIDFGGPEIVGSISFAGGLILFSFFVIFMYYTFGIAKEEEDDSEEEIKERSIPISVGYVMGGLVALAFGSQFTVDNASKLATILGVSQSLIGLTIVAIGTSLPELVTSVNASLKKRTDIAVGNVMGSNIFNLFLIFGITALIEPIPVSGKDSLQLVALFITNILLFFLLFVFDRKKLGKFEGTVMLITYFGIILYFVFENVV